MKQSFLSTVLAASLAATAAHATCVPVSPDLQGWERLDFDDIPPNTWTAQDGAVVAESRASSSILFASVPAVSAPVLTWRWRVDRPVPATDLTRKGGDDRSMSLTVGFAYDPGTATMGERMKRMVVETVAGKDAPGRVIEFVWGGMAVRGDRAQSPYSGASGRIVTLRTSSDPAGEWQPERIDLASLYREIWGSAPPPVTQVALLTDSDDTGGTTEARIAEICFSAG